MELELKNFTSALLCPATKLKLMLCRIEKAEEIVQSQLIPRPDMPNSKGVMTEPMGRSPYVLLREDHACAYPVIDEIPILLVPEQLTLSGKSRDFDSLCHANYAEAYEEMEFYNEEAMLEAVKIKDSVSYAIIRPILNSDEVNLSFPYPRVVWIDAIYDCAAQWDAYISMCPIQGKAILQLGGKGIHAVKMLLAGADEAWLITPMVGEALCARALACEAGVEGNLHCVVAVAEELPFVSEMFDGIYSGGCLHHFQIMPAVQEASRVLRKGGTFAAVEPWKAAMYTIGTKIFGQRESGACCRPLTETRLAPLFLAFREAKIVHHGATTRYLLLALNKLGVKCSLSTVWRLNSADDKLSSIQPRLRKMGSSVAVLGFK